MSEEEAKSISKMIGLAALKYGDLSNQATKDYVFDLDKFVSFEGNTGPYILYTIVRISSILRKYMAECGIEDTMSVTDYIGRNRRYIRFSMMPFSRVMSVC